MGSGPRVFFSFQKATQAGRPLTQRLGLVVAPASGFGGDASGRHGHARSGFPRETCCGAVFDLDPVTLRIFPPVIRETSKAKR